MEESSNLLNLGAAAGSVKEQITKLAAVGLDIDSALDGPGIALEDQDLMLGPTLILDGVHDDDDVHSGHGCPLSGQRREPVGCARVRGRDAELSKDDEEAECKTTAMGSPGSKPRGGRTGETKKSEPSVCLLA